METIRGKVSREMDSQGLQEQLAGYDHILLDLGTGDGRYAHTLAGRNPGWFVIGLDSCRENLRERSQAKMRNMLFVISSAQDLPRELTGLISRISINFPWGSLLDSLLADDPCLLGGLAAVSCGAASIEVRLNGGALAEAGTSFEAGAKTIYHNLLRAGWQIRTPALMNASTLKCFPSTWAKRLAFGRDPRAIALTGSLRNE